MSNPKVPLALGRWAFQDNVILRGPIPPGQVLIDVEESAPPYAPGFPVPKTKDHPPQPEHFRLSAKPKSGLPFARGMSIAYRIDFRAAGRFFSVRVAVAKPLSGSQRSQIEDLLSTLRVQSRV
jgi:hypothetical protein